MMEGTPTMAKQPEPRISGEEGRSNQQHQHSINKTQWNYTEMLSDEILMSILLQFIHDARTLARLTAVNKRFQTLLQDESVVKRVASHNHSEDILTEGWTWKDLGFYQAVARAGLFEEHRIGFDFACTDIDDDQGEASLIQGSIRRVAALGQILQAFDDATLTIEAHCGTAAPHQIAPGFSRARGEAVKVEVVQSDFVSDTEGVGDKISMNSWGRQVTERAAASSHKFGEIAREGRGWAEVYLKLGDREFPERPSYFEGLQAHRRDEVEGSMIRILW